MSTASYDMTHISARDILTKVSMYQVTHSPYLLKTPQHLMQSLKLGINIELATPASHSQIHTECTNRQPSQQAVVRSRIVRMKSTQVLNKSPSPLPIIEMLPKKCSPRSHYMH
jgi:hypothetical protein